MLSLVTSHSFSQTLELSLFETSPAVLDLLYEIVKGFKKEEIDGREEGVIVEAHTDPEAQMKILSM